MANEGLDQVIADIYDGIGRPDRAAMVRQDLDPHDGCADADETEILVKVLDAVPDSKVKKHDGGCWQLHAACLRDKLYADMGWE